MKNQHKNNQKLVYRFVGPAYMKFQPKTEHIVNPSTTPQTFFDRFKSFFNISSLTNNQSSNNSTHSMVRTQINQKQTQQSPISKQLLKYVFRLTNEDILIGNQTQLDAINVGGVVQDYVDTEHRWSINLKTSILDVTIDYKKNFIIILSNSHLFIYKFNPKATAQMPDLIASVNIKKEARFVRIIKGAFLVCENEGVTVYELNHLTNLIKPKPTKNYNIDAKKIKLLQVPEPCQNILNIFFNQKVPKSDMMSIWLLAVDFNQNQMKMGKPLKIRDVPSESEATISFTNYSKSIYFMHLGQDLLAMRGAYVLDIIKPTKNVGEPHFKLIQPNKLIHISTYKIQTYNLEVNFNKNPPKIQVRPLDSILLPSFKFPIKFINIANILGNNFLILFQNDSHKGQFRKGQIRYAITFTTQLKLEEKLDEVFPSKIVNVEQNLSKIEEKADMAQKMGLPRKVVYLNLWNKSQKSSPQDFNLLLDTLDYDMIRQQIERKLKKSSMNFRQVLLIQQGCLAMLHKEVMGTNCSLQSMKNYLISHLLTRKLELHRHFNEIQRQQAKSTGQDSGIPLINIQGYNFTKNAHVVSFLLDLVQRYCNEDKDQILKIRWIIRIFRFQFRIIYKDLLTEIISSTKKKFLKLLQALPELIPYQPQMDSYLNRNAALYQGIWSDFIQVQWQKCFYLDNVQTIQNKECLAEVCQSVWFKRHWLSQHDFVNLKKYQIEEIHRRNKSNYTFFYVIQLLFDHIAEADILRQTIDHIQDRYVLLPQHIYGKIYLYRNLFQLFKGNNKLLKIQEEKLQNFSQFLSLKDCEIFKAMFNYQKIKKGFIMKEMKPLYYSLSGPQVFHEGLLNYFASDLSQVSDIKCLLNRMNNEKKEFHLQNQSIYEVVVRAMQLKLKIGTSQDIPIEEVIIYIETIPLSDSNPILKDLQTMRIINQQAARFRKSQLNMSIFQITKNSHKVFINLIESEYEQRQIGNISSQEELKQLAYQILTDLLILHAKIYSQSDIGPILFIYLTRIMQKIGFIEVVRNLLSDPWIINHFQCDTLLTQNLVLYMRKWALTYYKSYIKAEQYLRKLVALLSESTPSRLYIESQLQLSILLSTQQKQVMYPLNKLNAYITLQEIESLLSVLPADQLINLQPQRLFVHIQAMQYWGSDCRVRQQKLENVYQTIILQLIFKGKIKEAIVKSKDLFQVKADSPYNFIFPAMMLAKIYSDFIDENRKILLECCSYLFSRPLWLLKLIQQLIMSVQTNQQQQNYLKLKLQHIKAQQKCFSQQNFLLQSHFISQLKNSQMVQIYTNILYDLFTKLKKNHEQFHKPDYYLMFIILCNRPEVLIKYIYNNRSQCNLKQVRYMLIWISECPLFKKELVLEFGVRLFAAILISIKSGLNIEVATLQILQLQINKTYEVPILTCSTTLEYKILKQIQKLKTKKDLQQKQTKGSHQLKHIHYEHIQQYSNAVSKNEIQYDLAQSDDNEYQPLMTGTNQPLEKESRLQFDQQFHITMISNRNNSEIMPYLSIAKQNQYKLIYQRIKQEREYIYGGLSLDRPVEPSLSNKNSVLTDPIRNSNRISRSQPQPPTKQHTPPQSNHLLSINGLGQIPKASELSQEEQQASYRSMAWQSNKDRQSQNLQEKAIEQPTQPKNNMFLETDSEINKPKEQNQNYIIEIKQCQSQNSIQDAQQQVVQEFKIHPEEIAKTTRKIEEALLSQNQQISLDIHQFYPKGKPFSAALQAIIKHSFLSQSSFHISLRLTHQITTHYPNDIAINHKFLQIYQKAYELQQKFSLNLPLKAIFVVQGLFIEQKRSQILFQLLMKNIYQRLNQEQLLKICKVVTIAFKKPDLQHEMILGYLISLLKQIQASDHQQGRELREREKLIEKAIGLVRKLPVKYLKKKDSLILQCVRSSELRQKLVLEIMEWCIEKKDDQTANYFQLKYFKT